MKKILLSGLVAMSLVGFNTVGAQDNVVHKKIAVTEAGAPVTIQLNGEPISKAFAIIEQASGKKIIVAESIGDPNLTIDIAKAPWNLALMMIVDFSGLKQTEKDGNIYIDQ